MSYINEPQIIYEHLVRMCEYRGARVTSRLAPNEFSIAMETHNYASITAERSIEPEVQTGRSAAHLLVIQFSAQKTIDTAAHTFEVFLDKQIRARPKDNLEYNIILVSTTAVSSAIQRKIAAVNQEGIVIEHYNARLFLIIAPEHVCVPRHTIVPPTEVATLCRELHMMVSNFPALVASGEKPDPMAVWLGLRTGMIVRIDRPSETSGIETVYRRCI